MSAGVDPRRPLPVGAAIAELARASLVRAGRGKALWVVLALAALPAVLAGVLSRASHELSPSMWRNTYEVCVLLVAVIPPVLVGAALADELEDRTSAYLWSRAIPRWAVVAGKLAGLAPLAALVAAGSAAAAYVAGDLGRVITTGALVDGMLGLAGAAIAASAIAALIATLVPRQAVAVAIGWMTVVDYPIGVLDARLHHLSTGFAARAIAGFGEAGDAAGLVTLLVLAGLAAAVACWRIGRIE